MWSTDSDHVQLALLPVPRVLQPLQTCERAPPGSKSGRCETRFTVTPLGLKTPPHHANFSSSALFTGRPWTSGPYSALCGRLCRSLTRPSRNFNCCSRQAQIRLRTAVRVNLKTYEHSAVDTPKQPRVRKPSDSTACRQHFVFCQCFDHHDRQYSVRAHSLRQDTVFRNFLIDEDAESKQSITASMQDQRRSATAIIPPLVASEPQVLAQK